MDPFALRKLGNSGVLLPQLGFGGAPVGNLYDPISDAESEATLNAAWAAGVRFYDTSPFYGRTLSEHRIGQELRRQTRSEVILSTKVGRVFYPPADPEEFSWRERNWPHGLHFEYRHDYTYEGVMRSYEDSLQRLGMNRIDLLLIHDLDYVILGSEELVNAHLAKLATDGINALYELKARGLIGAIGAGVNRLGTIPRFLDLMNLDFFLVASPYTLAGQSALDEEFPLCEKRGVGIIIGQVFASGILATGPIPGARYDYREPTAEEAERIRRIEAVCKKHGVPLASAALQFPLHHPLVASVIPGALHPDHVARNIRHMQDEIPVALWAELKHQNLIHADAPVPTR